jgi:hypothetical protein
MTFLRSAVLVTAVAVTILISYLAGGALDIGDDGRRDFFSLRDDAWQQSSAPALDTPFAIAWLPTSLASRASMATALGRKSALRDFGAAAAAATCVLFVVMLLQGGAAMFPALLATLGLAFGATFWARGVSWSLDALAPVWALSAVIAGRRWLATGDSRVGAAAAAAVMLAVVEDPAWAAFVPAAALYIRGRSGSFRGLLPIGVALGVGAVASVLARIEVLRQVPWAAVLDLEAPSLASMWALRSRDGWIPLTALTSLEFTALGQVLLVAGFVVLWRSGRDRGALGALVAGAIAVRYLTPQLRPELAGAALAIAGWALIATGLEWLSTTLPNEAPPQTAETNRTERLRPIITGLAGVLLVGQPAITRARMAAIGGDVSPSLEHRMATELKPADLPEGRLVISSSRAADSSILLSAGLADSPIALVPQRADLVASALEAGQRLVAFPSTRAQLASAGFLFERFFAGSIELSAVVGRQPCASLVPNQWTDVSLQLDGGTFAMQSDLPAAAPGLVSIYLAAPRPIRVRDRDRVSTPYESTLLAPDAGVEGRRRLEAATARGGGMSGWPITIVNVSSSEAPTQATFSLADIPQAAVAISTIAPAITLCSASARASLAIGSSPGAVSSARLMSPETFGAGWHTPEGGDATFRWTASGESSIRAHVTRPGPIRVTVTAMPAAPLSAGPRLGLSVNACALVEQPLAGFVDVSWVVPTECWLTGANQLWLGSGPLVSPASLGRSGDTRQLGARVNAVRLERVE